MFWTKFERENLFWNQTVFGSKYYWSKLVWNPIFFWTHNFLDTKFSLIKNSFGTKSFVFWCTILTINQNVFDNGVWLWRWPYLYKILSLDPPCVRVVYLSIVMATTLYTDPGNNKTIYITKLRTHFISKEFYLQCTSKIILLNRCC